jgi:hypothetical protein
MEKGSDVNIPDLENERLHIKLYVTTVENYISTNISYDFEGTALHVAVGKGNHTDLLPYRPRG